MNIGYEGPHLNKILKGNIGVPADDLQEILFDELEGPLLDEDGADYVAAEALLLPQNIGDALEEHADHQFVGAVRHADVEEEVEEGVGLEAGAVVAEAEGGGGVLTLIQKTLIAIHLEWRPSLIALRRGRRPGLTRQAEGWDLAAFVHGGRRGLRESFFVIFHHLIFDGFLN